MKPGTHYGVSSYVLKTVTESLSRDPEPPLELRLTCLADLDRTIDQIFERLQRTGETALLESLCPYFGKVWPSGRALAELLALPERRAALPGKRVLELGCGLALPSLAAARLGAAECVATDFHPDIPAFLEENLRLNAVPEGRVRYLRVDWREPEAIRASLGAGALGRFDWVLASDVLYEAAQAQALAEAVELFTAPGGARILIADPGRPYLQAFCDEMRKRGYAERVGTHRTRDEDGGTKEIFLLEYLN